MRGNNEGSIYQRKDGRWVASVSILKNGKAGRVSRYASTEAEARRKLTDLKHRQDSNAPVQFDRQNVEQWLNFWLDKFIRPYRKPRTWGSYDSTIRNYVLPAIGKQPLSNLPPEMLQELISYHHSRGRQRTASYIRTILRTAFKRAVKLGRMPSNPIDALDTVQVETKETAVFSVAQATALLREADHHRLGAVFWLAISLGLRKGELMGLELPDIDLDEAVIEVRQTLQRIKLPDEETTRLIKGSPKSKASRRKLPLPACAVAALEKHLVRRQEEKDLAGSAWKESGHLFTTPIGTPVDGDNLTKAFRTFCKEAGVPVIRFHDLRHSCGTFLHAQGVSPFTIQQILGHSQLVTTRRYTHVDSSIQKLALEKVGDLFEGCNQAPASTPDSHGSAVKSAVKIRLVRVK